MAENAYNSAPNDALGSLSYGSVRPMEDNRMKTSHRITHSTHLCFYVTLNLRDDYFSIKN